MMFIISEIFPQNGGDLFVAEQMILQSKLAGAQAVKVQLYPGDMFSTDGLSRSYLELSFDGLKRLKEYGDRVGIDVFATAFTEERLEWCMELDLRYLKVASRTFRESPGLVELILSKKKKTFVSVPHDYDTSKIKQVDHAVYLYCIAKYPTLLDEVILPDFRASIFKGYSDHSIGISVPLMVAALGCQYLEKHFTISHSLQKNTEKAHLCSMTVEELSLISRISNDMNLVVSNKK